MRSRAWLRSSRMKNTTYLKRFQRLYNRWIQQRCCQSKQIWHNFCWQHRRIVLVFVESTPISFLYSTPYEDFWESDILISYKVPMCFSCVSRGSNVFHPCSHFLFGDGGTIAAAFFQPQGRHPQQQHSFRMGNILPHTTSPVLLLMLPIP